MPRPHPEVEQRLAAVMHSKSDADEQLLSELQNLQARLAGRAALPDVCADLQDVLNRVNASDPELSRLQRQWMGLGLTPGRELHGELTRQQQLLEALISCVDEIGGLATAERERLRPELDIAARARQMCAAYAAAGRHR